MIFDYTMQCSLNIAIVATIAIITIIAFLSSFEHMAGKSVDEREKKIPGGIALPQWLWDKIKQEADKQDRSANYVILKVLSEHFPDDNKS